MVTYGKSDNLVLKQPMETKRNSQVAEQLLIQEKLIAEMIASLDNLSSILTLVTRAVPYAEENIKEQVTLVPLAEKIKSNNTMLIENISRITHIIETIEL